MSMNAIQFQRGLSLPQFQALYGSEAQCERALIAARWPHGWRCTHCGCKRFFLTRNGPGRQLWECFVCGYQSSSIVGTVMEHTHLPLNLWFLAMYLLTQYKNAISALALKRQLGVSYKTAWLLKHKLMQTMSQRDARYRLHGRVEIDDAYLGGERAGHINGGRKAANKTAFIAAVQTHSDGRPLYMRLTPVADFTIEDVKQWAGRHLAPGCHVVSDGTAAFAHVCQAGATHERHVTGGGRQGVQTPQLHWVNTLLSNLKTSMAGTYHSFDHAKYAARYLAEFCYRFNRRFDLPAMLPRLPRLLRALATTRPLPLKVLRI
ncbi:IS1595 family transposase [Polaromonas glacialis]|uniref:IS1595 family transposase n=1 Tax=Polaromonas glacialis TaxID=866564 RepID=UPI0004954C60|nr:IS1595 family transposase [Polaromonas glacialis]